MLLSEIIEQLQVGEFSQISFGSGAGIIGEEDYKKVALHVNLALANLYKRFNIKTGFVDLQLMKDIQTYHIKSDNSVRKTGKSLQYILDTPSNAFKDDINKIEKISWKHNGEVLPLNTASPDAVHMSTLTTLIVPKVHLDKVSEFPSGNREDILTLEYRAGYFPSVKITDVFVPEVTNFEFPPLYLEALLYFVASRVHNPIGLSGETFHAGNNYAAKYEAECQRIEQLGLQVDSAPDSFRFSRGGWV